MGKTVTVVSLVPILLVVAGCGSSRPDQDSSSRSSRPGGEAPPGSAATGIPPEHLDRIVELFNRGIGLMDQYQPVKAVGAFDAVVRLAPHWTTGRVNLGIALLNVHNEESLVRAEKELKQVLAEDPENAYAHYTLGMLLRHVTRFEEARSEFERVLQLDPQDADAHYQLGILIADQEPVAARKHLEETLKMVPHHESACYRLQSLLRKAGQPERAKELLLRFQALKSSRAGVSSGMRYGEMGRYAEVIRAFEEPPPDHQPHHAPAYADVAKQCGLVQAAGGVAGWPGERMPGSDQLGAESFGPGVTAADVDGDGDLDLYVPGVSGDNRGTLYLNDGGRFAVAAETGIDGRNAVGAYFGDYDADGDPDLYLTCAGPNCLYRNEGQGRFADVTEQSGTGGGAHLSVGACWADADHDGDLDLYVANFSAADADAPDSPGAPNALWRNNGDGSFIEVASTAGIDGGPAATVGVVFFDADEDRDLDLYLINHRAENRLFLNQRIGQYIEATSRFPALVDDGPGLGALSGDLDLDGREDLLLLRSRQPPRLLRQVKRGKFAEDLAFAATVRRLSGAVGGLLGDLDLDGDLDLVLLGAGDADGPGHFLLINQGAGGFAAPRRFADQPEMPNARGAVAVDLDGDGALELVVARGAEPPELWHAPAPNGRHWIEVIPTKGGQEKTFFDEPTAVGLLVEIKTGRRLQVAGLRTSSGYLGGPPPRAHFGLGGRGKVDYVRLAWPDAVLQGELEVAADQHWRVAKVMRKPSSCPILFSFDGERFAFVTDLLGVGGLGFFLAPGTYAPPDPTEDIRIPPEQIVPRHGRYLLRVAEPLEEVAYFDQLHLLVYDHPRGWEIYPDERFATTSPLPDGRPRAVAEKIFPAAARDERGQDVLDRILRIDRRYVEPPADPRFIGYAEDHWIELDFARRLHAFEPADRLVLYLYGWTEYTYSHVNYAAYQAGLKMRAPQIEVPDGKGGWRVAVADAGFPAGLPRMIALDVSSLPIRAQGRLRIRTNMEVFWDQIFLAKEAPRAQIRVCTLRPAVAQLRALGFPRPYSPDGSDPTIYDYHRLDQAVPFKYLTGDFTRFGDVRALLRSVDDHFVIMGRGEEIALEFDAAELPKLPQGWSRTLVLHADGYCKDMDLYTAWPDTVEPLPYHAMKNYPPAEPSLQPQDREPYRRGWNTRRIFGH